MFWTIIGILLILWLLGFIFHIIGGFIHILFLVAIILIVVRLLRGSSK